MRYCASLHIQHTYSPDFHLHSSVYAYPGPLQTTSFHVKLLRTVKSRTSWRRFYLLYTFLTRKCPLPYSGILVFRILPPPPTARLSVNSAIIRQICLSCRYGRSGKRSSMQTEIARAVMVVGRRRIYDQYPSSFAKRSLG